MDPMSEQVRLTDAIDSASSRRRGNGYRVLCAAVVGVLTMAAAARAETLDDATLKLGQRAFLLCQSCHSVDESGLNKIGPNLWGIFGRKAGSKADFHYSDALKNANVVWSEKTLDQWLAGP